VVGIVGALARVLYKCGNVYVVPIYRSWRSRLFGRPRGRIAIGGTHDDLCIINVMVFAW